MCGRYALYGPVSRLKDRFDLKDCPDFAPRYNIPPTTDVLIIRQRPTVGRVGQTVRWGLVPNWAKDPAIGAKLNNARAEGIAKDPAIGAKLNNARAEGIAEKPSFRTSFAKHRCLIPANGFFEWKAISEGGKVRKQPYFIRPSADDEFFAFAGLVARWRSPDGADLLTTCIITTAPNAIMEPVHDRMPVILAANVFDSWLDPDNHDVEQLKSLLVPAPADGMTAYPVGSAVNRAGVEGEELLAPLPI